MEPETFEFDRWRVVCVPGDGGRIASLRFAGQEFLAQPITDFRPPAEDYGLYETRPVFGYDDCMPTVDACPLPTQADVKLPDHGEVCWLGWDVVRNGNQLDFKVASELLSGLTFRRSMIFDGPSLIWDFEIANGGDIELPLLHVMHPLMPPGQLVRISLPGFSHCDDEMNKSVLDASTPEEIEKKLLNLPTGQACMLLLQNISVGNFELVFKTSLRLAVGFPREIFPTLGIWWNNSGYPDEPGLRRSECAFEPIPGPSSRLADCPSDGRFNIKPGEKLQWQIGWRVL